MNQPTSPSLAPNDCLPLRHTWVNNVSTTKVYHETRTWQWVRNTVCSFKTVTPDQRNAYRLFTGWRMKPHNEATWSNGHYSRCKDNVISVTFLTLDIDNQLSKGLPYCSYDEALYFFANFLGDDQPLECALYTSYNHLNPEKDATDEHPLGVDKVRVVIPLNSEILKADFEARIPALKELFPWAAEESFRLSQPFYPALQHPLRVDRSRSTHVQGRLLDLKTIEPVPAAVVAARTGLPSLSKVHSETVTTAEAKNILITAGSGTTRGETRTVAEWWHSMPDGYSSKKPCFSYLRDEKHATSFFYRDGDFIIFIDMGRKERRAIRVVPGKRVTKQEILTLVKSKKGGAA